MLSRAALGARLGDHIGIRGCPVGPSHAADEADALFAMFVTAYGEVRRVPDLGALRPLAR